MRIRTFCKFVELEELEKHTLKNCDVVIDGQNFFYQLYEKSQLSYIFGCECDKFATYLKNYLKMFKDANIKCYFIFKGGHKSIHKAIERKRNKEDNKTGRNPVFVKDVYKQVLNEMGFEYTISEYESKEDIIALAQKLNCPVISFDIEFCFSGVQYIPYNDDVIKKNSSDLEVGLFTLDNFLKKHKLTKQKLAIFITLTDEKIFGEDFFSSLMRKLKFPVSPYKRNKALLKWLSTISPEHALKIIYGYVDRERFNKEMENINNFICKKVTQSVSVNYLSNRKNFQITEKDPLWFEKGVASGYITIPYVNLYRSSIFFGSYVVEDNNADDSTLLSIELLIFASNLISNFKNKEFMFLDKTGNIQTITTTTKCVPKPDYEALESLFEDGWQRIKSLRLLEYFLERSLQGFNFDRLQKIPEEVRLLMISLIYFSRKKHIDCTNIACSVILSYVMLGVVFDNTADDRSQVANSVNLTNRPYRDSTTNKECITASDAAAAASLMRNYFDITESETSSIYDEKRNHPLIEFQHCLGDINDLNKLCGSPYTPTIYSKTYNGTFVYKILYAIENNKCDIDGRDFILQTLNPAATVLAYFGGIFDTYMELMRL